MEHEHLEAAKDYAAISGREYLEVVEACLAGDGYIICTIQSIAQSRRSNWGEFDRFAPSRSRSHNLLEAEHEKASINRNQVSTGKFRGQEE